MKLLSRSYRGSAIGLMLLTVGGCKKTTNHAWEPVRPALVAMVDKQTTDVFGPFAGTVAPRYESGEGFRASGRMIQRNVNVGDLVSKAQTLASLDETILRFGVVQSEADVLNAQAQLQKTQAADARKRTLIKTGAVPQSDVDTAAADLKTATAQLAQAQASLKKSKDQLGYADLFAEYDGVVTEWKAVVGQYVNQGQSVVTIARPDIREAVVDVPNDLVHEVKVNDVYDVRLEASVSDVAKGIVREIAPSSDEATRTRRVRLTLKNAPDDFRLGSTISISLTRVVPPRIEIPEAAVFDTGDKTAVWVLGPDEETVSRREVTVQSRAAGNATVSGALQGGDRVVIAGTHRLTSGQRVRPVTAFP